MILKPGDNPYKNVTMKRGFQNSVDNIREQMNGKYIKPEKKEGMKPYDPLKQRNNNIKLNNLKKN